MDIFAFPFEFIPPFFTCPVLCSVLYEQRLSVHRYHHQETDGNRVGADASTPHIGLQLVTIGHFSFQKVFITRLSLSPVSKSELLPGLLGPEEVTACLLLMKGTGFSLLVLNSLSITLKSLCLLNIFPSI